MIEPNANRMKKRYNHPMNVQLAAFSRCQSSTLFVLMLPLRRLFPSQLTSLNLSKTNISDEGLKEIGGLKHLTSLYLNQTRITDVGLKELNNFENLTRLNLQRTRVADVGLKEIRNLKGMTELVLFDNPGITDAGLEELSGTNKPDQSLSRGN